MQNYYFQNAFAVNLFVLSLFFIFLIYVIYFFTKFKNFNIYYGFNRGRKFIVKNGTILYLSIIDKNKSFAENRAVFFEELKNNSIINKLQTLDTRKEKLITEKNNLEEERLNLLKFREKLWEIKDKINAMETNIITEKIISMLNKKLNSKDFFSKELLNSNIEEFFNDFHNTNKNEKLKIIKKIENINEEIQKLQDKIKIIEEKRQKIRETYKHEHYNSDFLKKIKNWYQNLTETLNTKQLLKWFILLIVIIFFVLEFFISKKIFTEYLLATNPNITDVLFAGITKIDAISIVIPLFLLIIFELLFYKKDCNKENIVLKTIFQIVFLIVVFCLVYGGYLFYMSATEIGLNGTGETLDSIFRLLLIPIAFFGALLSNVSIRHDWSFLLIPFKIIGSMIWLVFILIAELFVYLSHSWRSRQQFNGAINKEKKTIIELNDKISKLNSSKGGFSADFENKKTIELENIENILNGNDDNLLEKIDIAVSILSEEILETNDSVKNSVINSIENIVNKILNEETIIKKLDKKIKKFVKKIKKIEKIEMDIITGLDLSIINFKFPKN